MLIEREFIYMKKPGWSPRNQKAPVNWELCSRQREEFDHPLMSHSNVHRVPSIHLQVLFSGCTVLQCCPSTGSLAQETSNHIQSSGRKFKVAPLPQVRGHPPTEPWTGQLCHPSLRLEFLLFLSIFGQQPSKKVSLNPQRQAPNTASAYVTQRLLCILQSLFLSPILKYYHGRKRIFEGRKQYKMKQDE